MTNKDIQLAQQPIITLVLTIVHATTSLPTYLPKSSNQFRRKVDFFDWSL
jgi:hypothetical protein